jgi:hypothetical protein
MRREVIEPHKGREALLDYAAKLDQVLMLGNYQDQAIPPQMDPTLEHPNHGVLLK